MGAQGKPRRILRRIQKVSSCPNMRIRVPCTQLPRFSRSWRTGSRRHDPASRPSDASRHYGTQPRPRATRVEKHRELAVPQPCMRGVQDECSHSPISSFVPTRSPATRAQSVPKSYCRHSVPLAARLHHAIQRGTRWPLTSRKVYAACRPFLRHLLQRRANLQRLSFDSLPSTL